MSINSTIRDALKKTVNACVPDTYSGEEETYCTFNYTENPQDFSDNAPGSILYDVQVHLFLPVGQNPLTLREGIKAELFKAGFTYPSILNMSDNKYQHHVFKCEYEWSV